MKAALCCWMEILCRNTISCRDNKLMYNKSAKNPALLNAAKLHFLCFSPAMSNILLRSLVEKHF